MPVACRNRRGSPAGERIRLLRLPPLSIGNENVSESDLPQITTVAYFRTTFDVFLPMVRITNSG